MYINTNPTCLLNELGFLNPNTTCLLNESIVLTHLLNGSDFYQSKPKKKKNSINPIDLDHEKSNK